MLIVKELLMTEKIAIRESNKSRRAMKAGHVSWIDENGEDKTQERIKETTNELGKRICAYRKNRRHEH